MMPNWLYVLPDDVITALVVAIVVGGDLLAAWLYRTFSHAWLPLDSARHLMDAHRLVITLTALVLAFSLLQAQTNIRQIHANLAQEAATLDLATREMRQLDGPGATELSKRLVDYGRAIVTEEWPLLAHGQYSTSLDTAYVGILADATAFDRAAIKPQSIYNDLLKNLALLGDLRDQRITAATLRLPPAFWHAIAAMTFVSVLLAAAIPATLHYRLATLLPSAALGVLIALVIIVDVPFQGQSAVRPTELEHVLVLIGSPAR